MKIEKTDHDKTAYRLSSILIKLNQGEKPSMLDLAGEFNVSLRTIQRDINERFDYLPIEKEDGKIYLHPAYLGKLSTKDIRLFAAIAGVNTLFPFLGDNFFERILSANSQSAYLVKGHNYENVNQQADIFKLLEAAIIDKHEIEFIYSDKLRVVKPYRLVNQKGIWYLAGIEDKLKHYSVTKILSLQILNTTFVPDDEISNIIDKSDIQWSGADFICAELLFKNSVADYFKRRKLIPDQEIINECENKDIIISGKFHTKVQLFNIIGYWLPNIKIVKPALLQEEFEEIVLSYIAK